MDHNLVVRKGKIYSNLIRGRGEEQVKGWVVIVKTEGRDQGDVVKIAVQEARRIVGSATNGETSDSVKTSFWGGIGVCTWEALCCNGESFGSTSHVIGLSDDQIIALTEISSYLSFHLTL